MSGELLFEIGTEEIPSGYLDRGLEDLKRFAEDLLKENSIQLTDQLKTYGTPRRLILVGKGVAEKQDEEVQKVTGPPKRAAFDENGNPTKAAVGFAKKQGVNVDELKFVETPKGEYLFIEKKVGGRPTKDVLAEILPKLIESIPWPKSMRWGGIGFSFARPIHWVLALFNGELIRFESAGVQSGNRSMGHRFMSPGEMEIAGLQDYMVKVREAFVIIDQQERKLTVEKEVNRAAETVSGTPMHDPGLVTTVTNLVEHPYALCGGFDSAFLDLPAPVLITPMKEHQKYFPLYDAEGMLMPHFIAVNNTKAKDDLVVQKGHERVLKARLADADFFFKEDRKRALRDRLDDLKAVIYQAELGTSFEKVERFTRLSEYISEKIAYENKEEVKLAARLCKCDLVTAMVMEFPSLQGVMGEEYARLDGHPEEVCFAIREHYLPARAGGDLPTSTAGAIVGVADRLDTISGCFAINQEPTGAADPFALRRHALATIRIIEETAWNISLRELISESLKILGETVTFESEKVREKITDFFRDRYKNMMLGAKYESDVVEAIISVGFDNIAHLRFRIEQLKEFMNESDEFVALVLTSKRIKNILKKQEESHLVDPGLFKDDCESRLWNVYLEINEDVSNLVEKKKFFDALNLSVRLRKPVDDLFDGVEILTKESEKLRGNRIGIIQELARFFQSMADFSKFSI